MFTTHFPPARSVARIFLQISLGVIFIADTFATCTSGCDALGPLAIDAATTIVAVGAIVLLRKQKRDQVVQLCLALQCIAAILAWVTPTPTFSTVHKPVLRSSKLFARGIRAIVTVMLIVLVNLLEHKPVLAIANAVFAWNAKALCHQADTDSTKPDATK